VLVAQSQVVRLVDTISEAEKQNHKEDINKLLLNKEKSLCTLRRLFSLEAYVTFNGCMNIAELYRLYQAHPVICTDTRNIKEGCLFFALKGEHFDGNSFALEALAQGAAYSVVSDPTLSHPNSIHVDNTLNALQDLARHHRKQLAIPFIAITGSNGKTTSKELISAALSLQYNVKATSGNLNNHIGVPLTILSMPPDTEIGIVEMGANHIGEIKDLCLIAMPTHGIITNIGKAHLEGFGSIEGVQQAKGELYDYLHQHGGFAFINNDDDRLLAISEKLQNKISYGLDINRRPDVYFEMTVPETGTGFILSNDQATIRSELFGRYNASNVVAAFTVGLQFNVDTNALCNALSSFRSGANRSEIVDYNGCTIVKDAYNANPSSMELAATAFAQTYPHGIIVAGDMKELGDESESLHSRIIELLSRLPLQKIFLVGDHFASAYTKAYPPNDDITSVRSIMELKSIWNWEACKGNAILLKGSRSMQLEKLLEDH
jgi:UDP-N-acetylmuramoyl-tripeptide--D-alanyl-D-alanine ligase